MRVHLGSVMVLHHLDEFRICMYPLRYPYFGVPNVCTRTYLLQPLLTVVEHTVLLL